MKYFNGSISSITPFDTIYINKYHYDWFIKKFELDNDTGIHHPYGLNGFDINFVDHVPKWIKKWIFPVTSFVEYDEKDKVWARPIKFGYEIETNEPAVFLINRQLIFDTFSPFKPFKNILYGNIS